MRLRVSVIRGIIPALAGNTLDKLRKRFGGSNHPRSRGEYLMTPLKTIRIQGSSPLSRGILSKPSLYILQLGIIPALAGNTNERLSIV